MRCRAHVRTTVALAALACVMTPSAHAQAAAEPQTIEIVGTSPMPGVGVDRNDLPYSSTVVRRGALDQAQADTLTDLLTRRVSGMQVNEIQGSPLQADLTYRGFRASGLLGASQGLSVFIDGVRVNEPFGDVVNWDLIPEFALAGLTVVPGANPAFGLNTLGGALVFETQNGRSAPGVAVEAGFGSFGRRKAHATYGINGADGWHGFVGVAGFEERGWRDHSPGRNAQGVLRIGRTGTTSWDWNVLVGRSTLVGNGLVPSLAIDDGALEPDLQAFRRSAVFTHPDRTRNRVVQTSLQVSHQLDGGLKAQALAHVRRSERDTLNGDLADDAQTEHGAPGENEHPSNAALNTTATRQRAWGLAASLSGGAAGSGVHRWQLGVTLDRARVRFSQFEQEATLDATRAAVPGAQAPELSAAVDGDATSLGAYVTDTWRVAPGTHITGTVRWNRSRVASTLTTVDDNTDEIEVQPRERFTYTSVNPALGIAHQPVAGLTLFANIARNTRVPTVIELGCADRDRPCRLPAGLQSDPYLAQVKATSVELGARWKPAEGQQLEATLHRTDNRDDILFGSVSTTGQLGYFRNFPKTRHQGLDLAWQGRFGPLQTHAGYSLLDATYEAADTLRMGERNVAIVAGTRMSALPRHSARVGVDWALGAAFSVGADAQLVGPRGVMGNEDGKLEDDEDAIHRLRLPGYGLLHLRASWKPMQGLELIARVHNVLDKRYASFGALAATPFDAQGRYTGEEREALFTAPGAPRAFFIGLRWAL